MTFLSYSISMEEEFSNVKITAVNPASCKRMMAGLKTILVRSWFPKLKKDEDLYIVEKPEKGDEETGLIVCIIKIKEVRDFTPADVPAACEAKWRPNYYSWEIHDLRVLDVPIPIKIQQEIFTLSLPIFRSTSYTFVRIRGYLLSVIIPLSAAKDY